MKKIPTLFKRVFENHKVIEVIPEITKGCEEAFKNGIATVKYDGSCCAIINGIFYKRYDCKKGKPIPENAIKCQNEPDPITGHFPCWVKCDRNNKSDKWFFEAFDVSISLAKTNLPDGTYEAIGRHFQGNKYNLNYDILKAHGKDIIEVKRDFESIKEFLYNNKIEGIVFWLNGEPICKIKRSDFGFEW